MNRGSEWRIWDLHFHTPSSYDYKDKSVTNEDIINILDSNNISVVAITDHHIIDIDRIKKLQELGKEKNIVVLPGIEFCSELGGSEAIHFIGIFPETADLTTIWTKIQGQCRLTPAEVDKKGQERISCPFRKTCNLITDELGGIVTIHAGNKSNSIEGIKNNLLVKQELKQELLSTYHPLLEVGKVEDVDIYKSKVFPSIKFSLPIIICSDNHNIKEYKRKENLWIKANTTFEGLKQILFEPEERVKIQTNKPDDKDIYKVIDTIRLDEDGFWKGEISLSSNLNTIIGGRSTGKSTLLKAIAAKYGSTDVAEDDYIKKHLNGISIKWRDGSETTEREIEYFPQSYMYEIAFDSKRRNKLIKSIIKNKEEGKLLDSYDAEIENISKVIRENIYSLFKFQEDTNTVKRNLLEKGNKNGIEEQLSRLRDKSSKLQKNSTLSDEEQKTFDEQARLVQNKRKLISAAEDDLSLLTAVSNDTPFASSFTDKYPFVKLNFGTNQNSVETFFNVLKEKVENQWKEIVQNLIATTQSEKEKILFDIQAIEKTDVYKKGIRAIEDNKELRDINNKIKEEEQKLADINKLEQQWQQMTSRQTKILHAVIDAHCSFKEKADKICSNLKISHDGLRISVTTEFRQSEMQEFL